MKAVDEIKMVNLDGKDHIEDRSAIAPLEDGIFLGLDGLDGCFESL